MHTVQQGVLCILYCVYVYISGGPLSALTCCVNARLLSGDKKNIAVNLFSKLGWELGLYYAGVGGNGSHSSGSGTGFSPSFFVGLGREEIKVCDAFWKQEMSPWSNVPPGLRNPFSKTYF